MHLNPTPSTTRPARVCRLTLRAAAVSAAALVAVMVSGPARAQAYPVYTITALPVSSVTAFNDAGQILGRGFVPCTGLCTLSDVPVLFDTRTGTLTPLGGTAQFDALNAQGQLAGTTTRVDSTGAPVRNVVIRQPDGSLTVLAAPVLSATQTSGLRARGLNARGTIALQHSDGLDAFGPLCGNYQAWVGTGATAAGWARLGPAGTVMHVRGLNAGGIAIGASVPATSCGATGGGFRATAAMPDGTLIDLQGGMPGTFSRAYALNDLGHAVGDHDTGARTAPDATFPQGRPIVRTAVWNTGSRAWRDIGPADSLARLNAVNNRGEVVGSAYGTALPGQPYIATPARAILGNLATDWPMADLNTLLAQNTDGWVLHEAVAVNAAGQIVVRGVSTAGSGHALLTPVSAPYDPYATAPAAPASLAASQLSARSAELTWTNPARNAMRLVVQRCKGNGCTAFVTVAKLPADTARFIDGALARRTTYRWRVRAGNAAGLSNPSNVVTATTLR